MVSFKLITFQLRTRRYAWLLFASPHHHLRDTSYTDTLTNYDLT